MQNTKIIINILHALKCFEKKSWGSEIDIATTQGAIAFMKQIIFPEIEKMIDYLSDKDLLKQREKDLIRLKACVERYYAKNEKMPQIRNITLGTGFVKEEILKIIKGHFEIAHDLTLVRYINVSEEMNVS
jgi:hypothetical protein